MKKIYILFLLSLMLVSCAEDMGNYKYEWVDPVKNLKLNREVYECTKGYKTYLEVTCDFVEGKSEDDYEYTWVLVERDANADKERLRDTIGFSSSFEYLVDVPASNYMLFCYIHNPETNITWSTKAYFNVQGGMTGWVFLEDHEGIADLSIYGLNGNGEKVFMPNILKNSGAPLELCEGPRKVNFMRQFMKGTGLWVMTNKSTFYLDTKEGHKFNSDQLISDHMAINVGDNYCVNQIERFNTSGYNSFLYADDGFYYAGTNSAFLIFGARFSSIAGQRIDVAPVVLGSIGLSFMNLLFDKEQKRFLSFDNMSQGLTEAIGNYPKGDELVYMQNLGNLRAGMAVMRGVDGLYELEFDCSSPMLPSIKSKKPMSNAKNLNKESFITFDQQYKNIYYSSGTEKVYTYRNDEEVEITFINDAPVEGKVTAIHSRYFFNTHMEAFKYLKEYEKQVVIATELSDGTGRVYFAVPEKGLGYRMEVIDIVETSAPVRSITYQDPN